MGQRDFPGTIYVVRSGDDDDSCLIAYESVDEIPDDEDAAMVVSYHLGDFSTLQVTKELV